MEVSLAEGTLGLAKGISSGLAEGTSSSCTSMSSSGLAEGSSSGLAEGSSSGLAKEYIRLYKGKFKLPPPQFLNNIMKGGVKNINSVSNTPSKVVVFDLDETLGSFGDLFLLWTGTKHIYPEFDSFIALLDLYPEFLRTGIFAILHFLYKKKKARECEKIFIYTNNQCPPYWISLITHYFQTKIVPIGEQNEIQLFDKVIGAFKIGNVPFEICRTSHKKIYSDLIRCTMLPKTTEFCFIDDTEYNKMKHDKIYYIRPRAYIHSLSVQEIIDRWQTAFFSKYSILPSYWHSWFYIHGRNGRLSSANESAELHKQVSEKLMFHIREFFLLTNYPSLSKYTKKKRTSFSRRNTRNHL